MYLLHYFCSGEDYYNHKGTQRHRWMRDLPIIPKILPNPASVELSSEEEWSDFSFCDLPNALKVIERRFPVICHSRCY